MNITAVLSRTGQTPRPIANRPNVIDPVVEVPSTPRIPPQSWQRDWAKRDEKYVRQGTLSCYITDTTVLESVSTGKAGRPAYSIAAMALACVLRVVDNLGLRQAEGRLRDLAGLMGYFGPTPDHSTISKRMSDTGLTLAVASFLAEVFPNRRTRRKGLVVLVDSTGLTIRAPGRYYAQKHNDKRKAEFLLLHIATDAETGEILAHRLTASTRKRDDSGKPTGPEIGDAPIAKELVGEIQDTHGAVDLLLGDGAYDARYLYELLDAGGGKMLAPFPVNAAYSGDKTLGTKLRNAALAQMNRIGEILWKERTGYHRRSSVEADIGAFKQTFGERVRAVVPERQQTEVGVKVELQKAWKTMMA